MHKNNCYKQIVFLIVDQWYISYFEDEPNSPEYRANALEIYYQVEKRNECFKKIKNTKL